MRPRLYNSDSTDTLLPRWPSIFRHDGAIEFQNGDWGDCPSDGSANGPGWLPYGNPSVGGGGGGGAGCHFNTDFFNPEINQYDGSDLVQDYGCQCNYNLKGDPNFSWYDWADSMISYYSNDLPWTGDDTAAGQLDFTACWVSNPQDMIDLANQIYFRRGDWLNPDAPLHEYGIKSVEANGYTSYDPFGVDPALTRRYYSGWNEVPVVKKDVEDPSVYDAGEYRAISMERPALLKTKPNFFHLLLLIRFSNEFSFQTMLTRNALR